jgi:hypothetical protein
MRFLLAVVCLLLLSAPAKAEKVFSFAVGGNGVYFDGPEGLPNDFELGFNARASLSPHISLVGSAYRGFQNEYNRGSFGVRLTATDVENKDFSIGLGIQRQVSSDLVLRPQEWASDVTLGYKPFPETMPRVILGALGSYGLDSHQVGAYGAIRFVLGGF